MSEPGAELSEEEKRDANTTKRPCIIGFGMDGVYIGTLGDKWSGAITVKRVVNDLSHNLGGWKVDLHPRILADIAGEGRIDIVGFGDLGVLVAKNSGNHSFMAPSYVLNDFCCSTGWRCDQHVRYLVDLRGDGRVDIVGFGDPGVLVSLNRGKGQFGPVSIPLNSFGTQQGWDLKKHPRFLADVIGDGRPDIVGFGEKHVYIARNKGDGTFDNARAEPTLDDFSYAYGWRIDHPRLMVDLKGNGKADILGFKNDGVFVSLNDGQGNFGPMTFALHGFGTCHGWNPDLHPRFVLPLTQKKTADIIGFGNAGVFVALGNGDGTFQPPRLVLEDFGVSQGWRVDRHTRIMVDVSGNGCPDIVGFGEAAIFVSYNDGHGSFLPVVQKQDTAFTASQGWVNDKTVRYVSTL